jgi:integrase
VKLKLDPKNIAHLGLLPDQAEQFYWDTDLSGFGLRLRKGSHRTYVVQYRSHGRTRRLNIGDARKVTAIEARKHARKILAEVELGGDPQGDKVRARQAAVHTLLSVAKDYIEAKVRKLRPASLKVTRLYLLTGGYFKPLHSTPVTGITARDVAARTNAIRRASGEVTAKQARAALSAMYRWAMGEGLASSNPVVGTNVPAGPEPRDRTLTSVELVAVWRACENGADFDHIVRLLILLGNRRSEIGGIRWSEIDLGAGVWSLPAARAKNKRGMAVPLPPAALAVITAVPRREGRDPLFGGHAGRGFTAWTKCKQALDGRLGDSVAPFRLHDLRRSCASGMQRLGVRVEVIERALNHVSGSYRGIVGVYQRDPMIDETRAAFMRWSEHVLALVEGREDKVVALRA